MNREEIASKLEKAKETLTKKEGTLAKHESKLAKIQAKIIAQGYKLTDNPDGEVWYDFSEMRFAEDDIMNTKKAIEKQRQIIQGWEDKLAKAEEDNEILKSFPDVFRDYMDRLVANWDEYDKNRYNRLREKRNELGYTKFCKAFGKTAYIFVEYYEEEKTHKENVKAAEALLKKLWCRIAEKVGDAQEWYKLNVAPGNIFEGVAINGFVKGTKGTVEVQSIHAGGHNIQRLHVRVLVKEI